MRILAIDPGSKCGWAIGDSGYLIASGVWNLAPQRLRRYEGGGMRYVRLAQLLGDVDKVDLVVIEEVRRHMGVDAAHVYGGVLATITAWCEKSKIPYSAEPVGTIKKFATGSGSANKERMIEAVKSRWAVMAEDDNEADAVALLYLAMSRQIHGTHRPISDDKDLPF